MDIPHAMRAHTFTHTPQVRAMPPPIDCLNTNVAQLKYVHTYSFGTQMLVEKTICSKFSKFIAL